MKEMILQMYIDINWPGVMGADEWIKDRIDTPELLGEYMDRVTFSDWYKDVNGFRPRGWKLEDMRDWMDREIQLQKEEQEAKEYQWTNPTVQNNSLSGLGSLLG